VKDGVGRHPTSGRWFCIYDGPRAPDGRRRQIKKSGFPTETAAKKYRRKQLADIDAGLHVGRDAGLVRDYLLQQYLPSQGHLRHSTRRTYELYLRNRVVPAIGGLRLAELRPHHLQTMYAALAAGGLSPQSVRHVHAIVRRAFNRAVDWGLLPVSPVRGLDLPTTPRRELLTWSPAQTRTFLRAVTDDRDCALWVVFLTTGLRRGEVLGLRWSDIRWEERSLQVVQQLTQVGPQIAMSSPKTRRSERVIAVDEATLQALREHRRRQAAEQLAWGQDYVTSGLVFTREDGSPQRPSSVSARWRRLQQGLDLPVLRLHDARHTHASLALESGVPLTIVSDRLGHSTITLTANTYGHVRPAVAREAADKVAALLFD
jgi:integrase